MTAWDQCDAYERFMGRWSRPLAQQFLDQLPAAPGSTWCDVGCGTGALAHAVLATRQPAAVLGVDTSQPYLDAAERGAPGSLLRPVLTTAHGNATAIPAADERFEHVVAGLVLNFVPDAAAALAEMRRVCVPGGLVGAFVWDYARGMQMLRRFWDAAVELDPAAHDLDEGVRFPICHPQPLRDLFTAAGLAGVTVNTIEIPMVFTDFDDFWTPFLGGQGPAGQYCSTLAPDRLATLRGRLRESIPEAADGSISLAGSAWAVHGTR
ncbi:class I SAM-dependent methyltransferase [Pseudonocardia sp. TRM90224]|uniref:class I SAM-dependent methyltransferase n=1 Tax=Pseudonocardia sp. TRM90224 TaxID=2812678 RepID=UPI001E5A355E|nr:class I SAM-dependent methyltransferase [Pseudonocardia sp. TRM90224]